MTTMKKIFDDYNRRQTSLELTYSSNPYARGIAYTRGDIVPLAEAKVPLMDQGFLHSDLTYDVPSVWDGRFFRLDDHLDRMTMSCKKMRFRFPIPREQVKKVLLDMLKLSGIKDAFVELIITRGIQRISTSGPKPEAIPNHLYIWICPYIWVMSPHMQLSGTGSAIIARTVRRIPPGAFDPTVKNLQWGDFTRGIMEAGDRGADYPLLTDGDGNLTEGSGFNICVIKDGTLYTPDRGVLEGVTRKSVFDVCAQEGIPVRMEVVPTELAYQADEIFTVTTAGGVMPVTKLDGSSVGDGRVGRLTKRIWDGYWAMHWDDRFSFVVEYGEKSRL
ncbi:uncharacterized protein MYCFIDRAFT_211746 [Pseudocercospora fijiensis CIRAD86]|uniref:Uncharacterized protein n=1 Tax=Pseudocercospora fijiensis (strain CIRAD86) TaxID=383855 RepID=M2ZPS9_PSEFD|nr:uncharacterized protein MYCFIDRAFT_211746 [Pseudocercospora fijiensis CIRAD86]EME81089.1 hypothetical protein MYCFIDRAFT_211746 [Pseudocercospora fijiensis CIRAD86]